MIYTNPGKYDTTYGLKYSEASSSISRRSEGSILTPPPPMVP